MSKFIQNINQNPRLLKFFMKNMKFLNGKISNLLMKNIELIYKKFTIFNEIFDFMLVTKNCH